MLNYLVNMRKVEELNILSRNTQNKNKGLNLADEHTRLSNLSVQ